MARKRVTRNEQIRQLFQLTEVIALRKEAEQRARKRATKRGPRAASLSSLPELQNLLTWHELKRIAEAAAIKADFLRESGTRILPKTLMKRIESGAVRVWGFR